MNEFNVIESPISGTNLIEASAGTGKTYTLSIIYLRLIVEKKLKIEDILVVTFTIAATTELRQKIRDRLREALDVINGKDIDNETISHLMKKYKGDKVTEQIILTALKSFDQASIYTIHSFCRQLLVDNAFESGVLFTSEIVKDNDFIKQGAADQWRKTLYNSSQAIVSYVMNNSNANELVELYAKRPLSTELIIKPEAGVASESLDRFYNLICAYYSELAEAWHTGKENVSEIFYRDNYLSGAIYRKASKEALLEDMDQYVISANPLIIFDKFENFTTDKIKRSLNKGNEYIENNVFNICQKIYTTYSEYINSGSEFLVNMKKSFFETMDELILNEKSISTGTSFDDLIKAAHRGLRGASGEQLKERVRARYKAALIDEFQDTDDLQFEIFNSLFNNKSTILFLIGDPKQAIYRFRGADIFSYLKAKEKVDKKYTLTSNWRSRYELIESVNDIFSGSSNPFVYDKIEFHRAKPAVPDQSDKFMKNGIAIPAFDIWLEPEDGNDKNHTLIERLSAEISLLINRDDDTFGIGGKKINPKDIAILVRKRRQGLAAREALLKYNIPSVLRGMDNVFESEDALSLYFIISAIADPMNLNFVKAALATRIMGYSANMLYEFNNDSSESNRTGDVVTRFYDYRNIWLSEGVLSMISAFLKNEAIPSRLFAMTGGDRMMTNINHIAEILHEKEYKEGFAPKELAFWFGNTISNPPDDDEYTMRLERDDDAVNIITMHACKGLEFPIVYCPFLGHTAYRGENYIIYHDPESDNKPVMYLDTNVDDDVKEIKETEDLAEDVRLLYVALTRAKSACRIMLTINRNFKKSAIYHVLFKSREDVSFNREFAAGVFREIADNSNRRISFDDGAIPEGKQYIVEKYSNEITAREFTGKIKERLITHSYSSISKRLLQHQDHDGKDFFSEYHSEYNIKKENGIFGFPAGAVAGLCVHDIFEKIDFTTKDRDYVDERCRDILLKYRFDQTWSTHLADMFFNVVDSTIDDTGMKLSDIGLDSRLSELEFLFPIDKFNSKRFGEIFKDQTDYCDRIYKKLIDNYADAGGMMKGFIDLVFVYDGKYYIADWKSNHIGSDYNDYIHSRLEDEMDKHNYYLQYYIYTTALNRYLKHRIPNYSYKEHMGGVFYFFVRGMQGVNASSKTGIFIDRPKESVIEKLDKYFAGEY